MYPLWWYQVDSNHRHLALQASALPTELWYHNSRVGRIRTCEFSCSQSKRGNRTPQLLVIKFSRLESNQRPFVYQTNALNQLSYVRMLEPLLGIEPRTIDYKSIVIPFNYRGLLHARKDSNPHRT